MPRVDFAAALEPVARPGFVATPPRVRVPFAVPLRAPVLPAPVREGVLWLRPVTPRPAVIVRVGLAPRPMLGRPRFFAAVRLGLSPARVAVVARPRFVAVPALPAPRPTAGLRVVVALRGEGLFLFAALRALRAPPADTTSAGTVRARRTGDLRPRRTGPPSSGISFRFCSDKDLER